MEPAEHIESVENRVFWQVHTDSIHLTADKRDVKQSIVGNKDRVRTAKVHELLQHRFNRLGVFDHTVGDIVDSYGFQRNRQFRVNQRLEPLAISLSEPEFDRANLDDPVRWRPEAGGLGVESHKVERLKVVIIRLLPSHTGKMADCNLIDK